MLAYGGASRFHPVSVHTLAELIRLAAPRPGARVLNAVDPNAPTVAETGAAVDAVKGAEVRDVLLDGPPVGGVGDTPWTVPAPVVCDMGAAERELGYRPVLRYAETLPETVAFIEERLAGRDWREAYPKMFRSYGDLFDYAAEDAWETTGRETGKGGGRWTAPPWSRCAVRASARRAGRRSRRGRRPRR